jgi:hypothetical protein
MVESIEFVCTISGEDSRIKSPEATETPIFIGVHGLIPSLFLIVTNFVGRVNPTGKEGCNSGRDPSSIMTTSNWDSE